MFSIEVVIPKPLQLDNVIAIWHFYHPCITLSIVLKTAWLNAYIPISVMIAIPFILSLCLAKCCVSLDISR